ncbi:Ankyrin repeat [Friedmanniella luteola]|uniref:Ankyrin repeat n=1 Tax=Friedmanniella luteola TaxID=546871 RepID=A0A1H1TTA1_9ACTN|nr:ankyrin repeat domain-containing protein [Friedmanniella luteola]SDS63321.1 Ankyrin repeat [Friedmanniella luteola]
MPTPSLPDRPHLDQLRRRARELQRGATGGDPDAVALLRRHLGAVPEGPVPLHLAQLALARALGFAGWPRLVSQVRVVQAASRDPLDTPRAPGSPLTELLRAAVLRFGPDDGPASWAHAASVLAAHPGLPAADVHAAAVTADVDALREHLRRDRRAASAEGGPFRWPPLLHLAFSRLGLAGVPGQPVAALELLLAAGADPDAGYCWQGLTPPFTALAGVLGGGEGGQPPHPAADALAARLLGAGADPNDGQALYNRMFGAADDHLDLLLRHGLGRGDGGPWRRRLPDLTDAPADLLATQLAWAVVHGRAERIRLLAAHGVDLDRPLAGRLPVAPGRTALQLARRSGRPEVVVLLTALGAHADDDPEGELVLALLSGDAEGVERLGAAHPDALPVLRSTMPSLVLRAAVADRFDGVRLLVELGFGVDALGRQDLPVEQPWETALHHAAGEGKEDLVRLLLALGADPGARDRRFDATPLEWARHLGRGGTAALLGPVTPGAPRSAAGG